MHNYVNKQRIAFYSRRRCKEPEPDMEFTSICIWKRKTKPFDFNGTLNYWLQGITLVGTIVKSWKKLCKIVIMRGRQGGGIRPLPSRPLPPPPAPLSPSSFLGAARASRARNFPLSLSLPILLPSFFSRPLFSLLPTPLLPPPAPSSPPPSYPVRPLVIVEIWLQIWKRPLYITHTM